MAWRTSVAAFSNFILHLDKGDGLLRLVSANGRRNCGYRMALVKGLVLGHNLEGRGAVGGDVGAGDYGTDAGGGLGPGGVYGLDTSVGVGTAKNLGEEECRTELKIGPVLCPAGNFVGAVMPHRPRSDDLVVGVGQDDIGCH